MGLAANCTRGLVVEQYQQRIPTTLLMTPRHELIMISKLTWIMRLGFIYLCRLETAPQIMYTGPGVHITDQVVLTRSHKCRNCRLELHRGSEVKTLRI